MLKLLIIEDDIIDQLTLTRLIKKNNLDCKITVSMQIQEAKSIMQSQNFDLVICDLNLPDGKAFDLGELISKQAFILLSGHLEQEIIDTAIRLGAIQVLQKSSELIQLRSILYLIQLMLSEKMEHPAPPPEKPKLTAPTSRFNLQPLMKAFNNHIESVAGTLEDFLNEKANMNLEIQTAKQSENRKSIKFVAHKLKSRCALIGLKTQQKIAEKIELESGEIDMLSLTSDMQKLNDSLEAVYPELEQVLHQLRNQKN